MKDRMRDVLRRWGQTVTVQTAEGETETRAFLQPLTRRDEAVPQEMTTLGGVDGRMWRYLGMKAVDTGDGVRWNGMEFCVRSSRPWGAGSEVLYWWAVLEQVKEAGA